MWLHRFTKYILQHPWQAVALTFISTFVPVIGIVGILIAALVTLRKGVLEGAILTVAATAPYFISFYVTGSHPSEVPLVVWAAVGVAALSNVLTWAFAVMLRKETSWSAILQIAALVGVLVISVIHLVYPSVADWWSSQLQSYYAQAKSVTGVLKNQAANASDMQVEMINITKQYATGLMVAGILFNAIMQLVVARWWEAAVFSRGLLRRELHGIRLSPLAGALFIASVVLSYLGNAVVLDIMPVLYLLFGAAGLSLIHYLFGLMKSPTAWFWLSLLYVTLIFSLPTSVVIIAIVALVDVWLDVRKRFKKI